jgi:hypothetical protein
MIEDTVEREGCAQVIFDDYSRALTSTAGQQLQAMLHGLLVNAVGSDRIGALVASRWGEKMHVNKAGSPLVSRLDFLAEPCWQPADLPPGSERESVEEEIGPTVGMLARSLGHDGVYDPRRITTYLDLNVDAILRACTPVALEYLAGRRVLSDLSSTDREPLQGLISEAGLVRAIKESQVVQHAMSKNAGWPTALSECAKTFASLVDAHPRAMWVDRFLFTRPANLRTFLIEVRKLTSTHLRLLGAFPPRTPIDIAAIMRISAEIAGVEVRTLTPSQYRDCHDRHVVFPDNSGYVLPVAEVVIGVGRPGTAVVAHAPVFPGNYARYWRGATDL